MPTKPSSKATTITIKPPNFQIAAFIITGTSPYVQNKFSKRIFHEIRVRQEEGSTANSKRERSAKDFQQDYEDATYRTREEMNGIPASAFRKAMISACRTVNYKMTLAKLSLFTQADGFDKDDGTPLIRFTKGERHYSEHRVRLPNGAMDIRARPMWDDGWQAEVRVSWDADQFTLSDVTNLMMRVGLQVGVGEGRYDSKDSAGMGWGAFNLGG